MRLDGREALKRCAGTISIDADIKIWRKLGEARLLEQWTTTCPSRVVKRTIAYGVVICGLHMLEFLRCCMA